jgi:hypothetical protein
MATSRYVNFHIVKREVSLLQVLEHYGLVNQLRGNGNILTGACPIHGGNSKTAFCANLSNNYWNCLGHSSGGGNIIDFVAKREKVSILDAANLLVDWFTIKVDGAMLPTFQGYNFAAQPTKKIQKVIIVERRILSKDGEAHILGPPRKRKMPR